ncbi:MAG: DUF1467 family protein [Roseovarius sp.]|nr:DUF1467 family protein [Roseovarius sp.]
MSIASAIVLFLVIWFMTFLTVLPIRIQTQDEAGRVLPGTHSGSPERHHLKRKILIATGVAAVLWAAIFAIVVTGTVTVRDIDMFDRMGPAAEEGA